MSKITDPALLEALQCATARQWRVVPMHGVDAKGKCSCKDGAACTDAGKHPCIKNYYAEASADVAQIKRWAAKFPGCNWGLPCAVNGLVAIDADPHRGANASLLKLKRDHGRLPTTPRANTGGDGLHILYLHPGPEWKVTSDVDVLGPGLDIKGDGGLIVLAGSLHRSGKRYGWVREAHPTTTPVAPMPDWLRGKVAVVKGVIERSERVEENRDNGSNLSALSSLSITEAQPKATTTSDRPNPDASRGIQIDPTAPARDLPAPSCDMVEAAIVATTPSYPGVRNRMIFEFARHLKQMPELVDAEPATLRPLVKRWHAAALPFIGTRMFDDSWADFLYGWKRVKYPRGSGTMTDALEAADATTDPPEAQNYECPHARRLIRLCRELQRRAGPEPFYLSNAMAADMLGIDPMTAWRRFNVLVADGVLAIAKEHTANKATRYRYLQPL